jgi:glyoxylase-like metal-dependent hydrolase (beta-lactamase superfamily II)
MFTLGRFEITSIVNGTMRLDGGAMFGVVPKVLWQNLADVDSSNRILLATRTLLAVDRAAGQVVLVDTGCGSKWGPKEAERYGVQPDPTAIPRALETYGLRPQDVTDVVVTHLHFDHNGGLTYWYDQPGERTCLTYAKAIHWIHRRQWEHAHRPTVRDRASFLPQDFEALESAGVLRFVDGDEPKSSISGIDWFLSHGHTPYQLLPVFRSPQRDLMFVGDIVPMVAHLRLGWVMAYDLFPLTTVAERERIYAQALGGFLAIALPHDLKHGAVALGGTIDRPIVTEALEVNPEKE